MSAGDVLHAIVTRRSRPDAVQHGDGYSRFHLFANFITSLKTKAVKTQPQVPTIIAFPTEQPETLKVETPTEGSFLPSSVGLRALNTDQMGSHMVLQPSDCNSVRS